MESKCTISSMCSDSSSLSVWNAHCINGLALKEREELRMIIDEMGKRSAISQNLKTPITDYGRIMSNEGQNVYLWTIPHNASISNTILVVGLLKTGVKNLYIIRHDAQYYQTSPLCVLDFYVHEKYQRIGIGHHLFEAMLENEKKMPHQLGYDRPSAKLLSFLSKHYDLDGYIPQVNRFVVFDKYFDEGSSSIKYSSMKHNRARKYTENSEGASTLEGCKNDNKNPINIESENCFPAMNSLAKGAFDISYRKLDSKQNETVGNMNTSCLNHSSSNSSSVQSRGDSNMLGDVSYCSEGKMMNSYKEDNGLEEEFRKLFPVTKQNDEPGRLSLTNRSSITRQICRHKQISGSGVANALIWSKGYSN